MGLNLDESEIKKNKDVTKFEVKYIDFQKLLRI